MKNNNPKFKIGDIVKYLDLPSAVAIIKENESYSYYMHRNEESYERDYLVKTLDGDINYFNESELKLATEEEKDRWYLYRFAYA